MVRPAIYFAKVITSDFQKAARVSFPKYEMDKRLNMYFKEKNEVYAFRNEKIECGEGDYVLIREVPETPVEGKRIKYNIEKLLYKLGHYIDPISGKRNAGIEYVDEIRKTAELFGYNRPYFKTDAK